MTGGSNRQPLLSEIELSVKEKHAVDIPVWASFGAIGVGGVLLVFGNRKG